MTNFPHLDRNQLLEFERRLLAMIGFQIFPLATPSACVRHLLRLWLDQAHHQQHHRHHHHPLNGPPSAPPPPPPAGQSIDNDTVAALADHFIMRLHGVGLESLRYAPSTIAMAALLLSFSKLKVDCTAWLQRHLSLSSLPLLSLCVKVDCTAWLQRLPDAVFPDAAWPLLDVDACLFAMQTASRATVATGGGGGGGGGGEGGSSSDDGGKLLVCSGLGVELYHPSILGPDSRRLTPTSTAELTDGDVAGGR